jgi:hypothetical protein
MATTAPAPTTNRPSRKVVAAGGVGSVAAFVLWLLGTYVFKGTGIPLPVEGAVEFVVPGLAAGVAGWWVRNVEHKE